MAYGEDKNLIEEMRRDLAYAANYRERGRAASHLAQLLSCEFPGTKTEVVVQRGRWWRRNQGQPASVAPTEIVLTDHERREFRDWLRQQAQAHEDAADRLELKYAGGN